MYCGGGTVCIKEQYTTSGGQVYLPGARRERRRNSGKQEYEFEKRKSKMTSMTINAGSRSINKYEVIINLWNRKVVRTTILFVWV